MARCSVNVAEASQCGDSCNPLNRCNAGLSCVGFAGFGSCGGDSCLSCATSPASKTGLQQPVQVKIGGGVGPFRWTADAGQPDFGDTSSKTFTVKFVEPGRQTISITDQGRPTSKAQCSIQITDPSAEEEGDKSPIADIRFPSSIQQGKEFRLDGSGSKDPDVLGSIRSYTWDIVFNGETVAVLNGVKPSYTPEHAGTYTVRLTVIDQRGNNGEKIATFRAIAQADSSKQVLCTPELKRIDPGQRATLTAEQGVAPYSWRVTPSTAEGFTQDGNSFSALFPGADQSYTVTVEDSADPANSAECVVRTGAGSGFEENQAPIASISYGPATVYVNDQVTLSAELSYDPDGEIIRYEIIVSTPSNETKRFSSGPTATMFANERGTYKVELIVTDDGREQEKEEKVAKVNTTFEVQVVDGNASPQVALFPLSAPGFNDDTGTVQNLDNGLRCGDQPIYIDINNNDAWDFADCVALAQNLENPGFQNNAQLFDVSCGGGLTDEDAERCTQLLVNAIERGEVSGSSAGTPQVNSQPIVVNESIMRRAINTIKRWFNIN